MRFLSRSWIDIARVLSSSNIFVITRSRISDAAFLVKVIATISSGSSTLANNARNLSTSEVFPDPAGALTTNDWFVSNALCLASESAGIGLL